MIIILFPQAQDGREINANIEECRHSFKRAVQISGDENIKSSNYFLANGLESLKGTMAKKFAKNINEHVVSYYRDKKNKIKNKTKRLIVGQIQHIRYTMKSALYSLITSNDFNKSIQRLEQSYS